MARLAVEHGREIYYEHHEGGDGVPVLFVHGWGMSARVWDGVVPWVRRAGHDVVALDDRCVGSSDKDFKDVSVDAIGGDVVRLVDHLGLDGVVLNGWSHGGAVVVSAAARLGSRLRGLVLTGGATPRFVQGDGWPHGNTAEGLEEILGALEDDRAVFLRGLSDSVCQVDVGEPTVTWMWDIFMQASPAADESLRDLGATDQRDILPTLDVPALLCAGHHDAFVPIDAAREQAKMLPNAKLVEFEQSGHATFLEERQRYRETLTKFLGEC